MENSFTVLLYEALPSPALEALNLFARVRLLENPLQPPPLDRLGDVDAIIIRAKGNVTKSVIDSAPQLRVIGRHGIGVDNIDVAYACTQGIRVVNTPDANFQSVAEFIVGQMLCMARRFAEAQQFLKSMRYDWRGSLALTGIELAGKTAAIIGAGRTGRALAKILACGFSMRVRIYDYRGRSFPDLSDLPQTTVHDDLTQTVASANFLSLNVPLTPNTKHIVDENLMLQLAPGAFVINSARGEVLDEQAALALVASGRLGGLALDVFIDEPLGDEVGRVSNPKIVATPHIASYTEDAFSRMGAIVEDVRRVLHGEDPKWAVA